MVVLNNGQKGAVTFIGTVSPAGGNLKEPVTESTKKAARCFYALEQNRADQKRYPAVNPIDSYSKYLEYPEIQQFLDETVEPGWVANIGKAKNIVRRGREAADQINILGDDGVPMSYHITFWKSELIDFCFLQQDAFDPIDSLCPIERQKYMLDLVLGICDRSFTFDDYEKCREYFKNMIVPEDNPPFTTENSFSWTFQGGDFYFGSIQVFSGFSCPTVFEGGDYSTVKLQLHYYGEDAEFADKLVDKLIEKYISEGFTLEDDTPDLRGARLVHIGGSDHSVSIVRSGSLIVLEIPLVRK